jgi:hypothetical protein
MTPAELQSALLDSPKSVRDLISRLEELNGAMRRTIELLVEALEARMGTNAEEWGIVREAKSLIGKGD